MKISKTRLENLIREEVVRYQYKVISEQDTPQTKGMSKVSKAGWLTAAIFYARDMFRPANTCGPEEYSDLQRRGLLRKPPGMTDIEWWQGVSSTCDTPMPIHGVVAKHVFDEFKSAWISSANWPIRPEEPEGETVSEEEIQGMIDDDGNVTSTAFFLADIPVEGEDNQESEIRLAQQMWNINRNESRDRINSWRGDGSVYRNRPTALMPYDFCLLDEDAVSKMTRLLSIDNLMSGLGNLDMRVGSARARILGDEDIRAEVQASLNLILALFRKEFQRTRETYTGRAGSSALAIEDSQDSPLEYFCSEWTDDFRQTIGWRMYSELWGEIDTRGDERDSWWEIWRERTQEFAYDSTIGFIDGLTYEIAYFVDNFILGDSYAHRQDTTTETPWVRGEYPGIIRLIPVAIGEAVEAIGDARESITQWISSEIDDFLPLPSSREGTVDIDSTSEREEEIRRQQGAWADRNIQISEDRNIEEWNQTAYDEGYDDALEGLDNLKYQDSFGWDFSDSSRNPRANSQKGLLSIPNWNYVARNGVDHEGNKISNYTMYYVLGFEAGLIQAGKDDCENGDWTLGPMRKSRIERDSLGFERSHSMSVSNPEKEYFYDGYTAYGRGYYLESECYPRPAPAVLEILATTNTPEVAGDRGLLSVIVDGIRQTGDSIRIPDSSKNLLEDINISEIRVIGGEIYSGEQSIGIFNNDESGWKLTFIVESANISSISETINPFITAYEERYASNHPGEVAVDALGYPNLIDISVNIQEFNNWDDYLDYISENFMEFQ